MSQVFHKILRKPLNQNTIRALINHQNPIQTPISHLLHQPQLNTKTPFSDSSSVNESTHFNRLHIYPSFSFGYFLNPISSNGLLDFTPEEVPDFDGSGSGGGMIWADSVKKKRKKKMNKHKLKKLKKRLRHCS
ncbi:hypothetical protein QVD17_03976 [Tagetes erecta]|uniref:Small ribosomal subunit protein mS38 n=1 Tax=Tagetes erecta TaxID=13708 RepID=A0AAD8LB07_TARER|nr:hypothetical protein QVD17_03976 [Tagetes erecta]